MKGRALDKPYSGEFLYQVSTLVLAVILVHALYVAWVRPNSEAILEERAAQMRMDPDYVPARSLFVIIRDFEQEACFILALWALAIMGYKGVSTLREQRLLDEELVPLAEGARILPEDSREYVRQMEELSGSQQRHLLPRGLRVALQRFRATRNIQDVSDTAHAVCEAESERLDSELSMVRYIAWAIPSIGFIGTVRGIGEALGLAHQAVEGDVSGITQSLGTAFNSTFIALLLSIVLMFLLHQLQLQQERLVLDCESYLDQHLIQHLQVP